MQIGRQIIASLIAEQVADHDYLTVKTQVQQAQDVQAFLQTSSPAPSFYGWMQSHLSALYYQYYRFACDTARQAEQTMKQELMRPELDHPVHPVQLLGRRPPGPAVRRGAATSTSSGWRSPTTTTTNANSS